MTQQRQKNILEISVFVLVVYTSAIVGTAEHISPFPWVLTLPVAIVALVLSRRRPKMLLKPLPAFVLGLLAFGLAFAELFSGSIEARLTAGVHLMVYLAWIVLLMDKQLAQYWWIFALCVLQVAVGAVLMSTVLYGVFLFGLILLSLWTLAVFCLHRAHQRFAPADGQVDTTPRVPREAGNGSPPGSTEDHTTRVSGTIHTDPDERWLSARFAAGMLGMAIGSAFVGAVFFVLIPRLWLGSRTWGMESDGSGATLVGFSENVKLGDFGTLLESNERVLEVRMFDRDGSPLSVEAYARRIGYDEPLFRGRTLDTYQNGAWSKDRMRDHTAAVAYEAVENVVRQEFRLKPIGTRVLFAVRANPERSILAGHFEGEQRAMRSDPFGKDVLGPRRRSSPAMIRYTVFTRPDRVPRRSRQPQVLAQLRQIDNAALRAQLEEYLQEEVGLRAVTVQEEVGRKLQRRASDGRLAFVEGETERAQKIVAHLRDSGRFTYSLRIPAREHRDLDPVVEFLRYRRAGHCEYFATALALLLRAAGIPTRLVSGFKGGAQNSLTGYFDVEQRHAHAWVEAYVDGEWTTLDATPAARADAVENAAGILDSWRSFKNFLSHLWSSSVLEIDFSQQDGKIYNPLLKTTREAWRSVSRERRGTAAGLAALKDFLIHPDRWFSWQGALVSFCLLLLLASTFWAARRVLSLFRGAGPRGAIVRRRVPVEFYERFCRLCRAGGFVRSPVQTQREFADDVSRTLISRTDSPKLRAAPAEVAAAFYEVRFGNVDIPPDRRREIDSVLTQLEAALQHPPAEQKPA